jgi:hypothetical protein
MALQNNMPFAETVAKGSYSSYGGADITCVIGNQIVGTLQAISYSVTREKGPVYTMRGTADPIAFARGKRAVAGTLVLLTVNKSSFLDHMRKIGKDKFFGSVSDIKYDFNSEINKSPEEVFQLAEQLAGGDFNDASYFELTGGKGAGYEKQLLSATYADQILPFDVNISAANEYGNMSKMSVVGVEILNQGAGVSIDDLVLEEQYTFIARGVTPLIELTR